MDIKRILVDVNGSVTSIARLETAFNLADQIDASVDALYVIPEFVSSSIAGGTIHGGWYIGRQAIEEHRQHGLNAAAEVRIACDRVAKRCDQTLNWIEREGSLAEVVVEESRYHDLLMVGVPDSANEPQLFDGDLGRILLSAGRSVLVMPGVVPTFTETPANVLVAWDGSREAAKAVAESLLFLKRARSVMVVSVFKHRERADTLEKQAVRLVRHLEQHNVHASAHVLKRGKNTIARCIVEYAADCEVDMLVMGAYGHSRFQEIVLGGMTRDMLHNAATPLLLAH